MARIYKSPFPAPNVPTNLSLSQYLLQTNPDDVPNEKIVLRDFDSPEHTISYAGIREAAAGGAAGLKAVLGLKAGDVICIYAKNSVNWAILAHAVMWAGGCVCAINPLATSYELKHYFELASPVIIAVDVDLLPNVEACCREMSTQNAPALIAIDPLIPTNVTIPVFPRDILTISGGDYLPPIDLSSVDNRKVPGAILFSSGTSGLPKAVLLSHYNLIAQLLTMRSTNPFTANAHLSEVFFPPFAHIYGMVAGVLLPAWVGCHCVAMPRFDFTDYVKGCQRINATVLRLVPATAVRLVKDPSTQNMDLSSVKTIFIAGAALAPETAKDLGKMLHPEAAVLNGYGMTEATITLMRETRAEIFGSVGRPAAGVEIRLVNEDGIDVDIGEDGECWVRGPTVFMGYKGNQHETISSFHDDWLKTGDILQIDRDQFFWLTGRKKELIKYKGNQVPPSEIEAVLLSHIAVAEAGVCGIWNKKQDTEVPAGCVVLTDAAKQSDRSLLITEILNFVHERVSAYKRLRGGLFVLDALPKGNSGKLLRRELPLHIESLQGIKSRAARL